MKTPGAYLLTIRLRRAIKINLKGRELRLKSGWYTYAGSAMAGLESRLGRHLRTKEHKHWHVDWLLANGEVADIQVWANEDPQAECRLMAMAKSWDGAEPINGFGSTDCTCKAHLCYFRQAPRGSIHCGLSSGRIDNIFAVLNDRYVEHASFDRDPFETLVSCILSLRTQDPVTDKASKRLFAEMRTPAAIAAADHDRIAELIFPVGMYRQKAKRLVEIGQQVLDRFDGQTPAEIDDLLTLPGVGRKTANLVRSFAFHLPAICVDTHVHRITNRWGLVRTKDPDDTECELRRILPEPWWGPSNPLLVQHGQQICRPHRPSCGICPIRESCGYPHLQGERQILAEVEGAPDHPSIKIVKPGSSGNVRDKQTSPFEK